MKELESQGIWSGKQAWYILLNKDCKLEEKEDRNFLIVPNKNIPIFFCKVSVHKNVKPTIKKIWMENV